MRSFVVLVFVILCSACEPTSALSSGGGQGVNHRVREGETLYAIAEEYYGNGLLWPEIRKHNPWVRPDDLRAGEIIYVPPLNGDWGRDSITRANQMNPGAGDPGYNAETYAEEGENEGEDEGEREGSEGEPPPPGGGSVFANLPSVDAVGDVFGRVSSKNLFGIPLGHVSIFAFLGLLVHSMVQSILVWLATIFTFVKNTSFKKSMKAVFLTESLTFMTLVVVGVLAILMLYLGSKSGEFEKSQQLFPTFEQYLATDLGIAISFGLLLLIYSVLSLRFYPQVMGIKSSQAVPVLMLAVLIPHLLGMYFLGQRLGLIPAL